jgi:hypothetical protein
MPPLPALVVPGSGPNIGQTQIDIFGTGFVSGVTAVLGGNPMPVTFLTSGHLKATTPAHAIGLVGLVLTNPDTTSGGLLAAFTYLLSPSGILKPSNFTAPVRKRVEFDGRVRKAVALTTQISQPLSFETEL